MTRGALVAAIVCAASAVSARAAGDAGASPEARAAASLQRGLEHYDEGDFELAIAEFRAGYELDPRPDFLFALAQAERLGGDCAGALIYYERFLATNPAANQAEAARLNAKRCEHALDSKPDAIEDEGAADADAAGEEADEDLVAAPVHEDSAPSPSPWYRDLVAVSLAAGGAASLGIGAWSWREARAGAQRAAAAATYADYAEEMKRARTYRTIAWVGAGVSAAAFTGAAWRALTRSGGSGERPVAALAPVRGGAVIAISNAF